MDCKHLPCTPSNYRPISLTTSCCKVIEHVIFHSIMDLIKTNNILISNQHGFRPVFSCQTRLISLIDDISCAMDTHYQIDLTLLAIYRLQQSFWYSCLLAKLQYYKINNLVWKWIHLTECTQSVVVDGPSYKPISVLSGVLQETVLGPLMFLLYINDIYYGQNTYLLHFAYLLVNLCLLSKLQLTYSSTSNHIICSCSLEPLPAYSSNQD